MPCGDCNGVDTVDELDAVFHLRPLKNPSEIRPHSRKGEAEFAGNLLVAFRLHQQPHNLLLLRSQPEFLYYRRPRFCAQWRGKG